MTIARATSLCLMADLVSVGLPVGAAAEISKGIEPRWEEPNLVLLVQPSRNGPEPFEWAVGPRAEVPDPLPSMVLRVELEPILHRVLRTLDEGRRVDPSASLTHDADACDRLLDAAEEAP